MLLQFKMETNKDSSHQRPKIKINLCLSKRDHLSSHLTSGIITKHPLAGPALKLELRTAEGLCQSQWETQIPQVTRVVRGRLRVPLISSIKVALKISKVAGVITSPSTLSIKRVALEMQEGWYQAGMALRDQTPNLLERVSKIRKPQLRIPLALVWESLI